MQSTVPQYLRVHTHTAQLNSTHKIDRTHSNSLAMLNKANGTNNFGNFFFSKAHILHSILLLSAIERGVGAAAAAAALTNSRIHEFMEFLINIDVICNGTKPKNPFLHLHIIVISEISETLRRWRHACSPCVCVYPGCSSKRPNHTDEHKFQRRTKSSQDR